MKSRHRVNSTVRRLRLFMETILELAPVLVSVIALGVSIYALSSTKRDLKKAAERQFLETSSTTCHHILADLNMCLATGELSFNKFVDSEPFNQIVSHKQSALRFQEAKWYADFEGMLGTMEQISEAYGQVARQMRERNAAVVGRDVVTATVRPPVVNAANAVAKYINTARDRLATLR